jgi:hypothetical protein
MTAVTSAADGAVEPFSGLPARRPTEPVRRLRAEPEGHP